MRFIPTVVGNTGRIPNCGVIAPVHPHGRGEHNDIKNHFPWWNGSSPRSWGTRAFLFAGHLVFRFIPTVVGNTGASHAGCAAGAVHPHGRGEHRRRSMVGNSLTGSSPRSWGTRGVRIFSIATTRFIPTVVGNTFPSDILEIKSSVHPHGRGEHAINQQKLPQGRGSSPRSWGTLFSSMSGISK